MSNRLSVGATPTISPYSSTSLLHSEPTDSRGTIQTYPETSNQAAGTPLGNRLLFQHLPGSQIEWGTEVSDQPESPQPVCSPRTLQDGGHPHLEGPTEARRLVGKNRPQGCLSGDSHSPDTQRLPQVPIPRQNIPLHLPAVRTIFSPLGLYQDIEICPDPPMCEGSATDCLYRQHTSPSRVKGTTTRPPGRDMLPARMPGVHHQHGEVGDDPRSCHRVSWPHSKLNQYGAKPPTSKDKTNSSGGSKINVRENHLSCNLAQLLGKMNATV